ncbi:MAG: M1 family metallopeptidase [Bacteroidota bacterium]
MRQTSYFILMLSVWLLSSFSLSGRQVAGNRSAPSGYPSARIANYAMDIRLDPATKTIYGAYELVWNNPSGDTIRELHFHLYQNAFRNNQSTYFSGSNRIPDFLRNPERESCEWANVKILEIRDQNGVEISDQLEYIQPDDNNKADRSVMRVPLSEPVAPNGQTTIQLKWEHRVPKTMPRTGYNKDYYFLAQWFPKLGVYEPKGMRYATFGQWNCHQYHSNGEYYANFGVYKVNITVPSNYVVGASGVLQQQKEKEGLTTYAFLAEDVIDFTWTTSPHFQALNTEWKGIPIRILHYPSHAEGAKRYVDILKYAMDYFEARFEKWPYPHLTVVDPPLHGLFSVGMEYPTLVTGGTFSFLPEGLRTPETLVVHEFAHQYFMQLIATNETEEAWMDEGFVTYHEGRIMDSYYGDDIGMVDWMGLKIGNKAFNRGEFLSSNDTKIAPIATKSWNFKHGGYGTIAYNKTAMWLHTLEGIVGLETMDAIMRTYYNRWKYNHPCGYDFVEIANEVVQNKHGDQFGDNLDWFFDQMLNGTDACDYAIRTIENNPLAEPTGYIDDECITKNGNLDIYQSSVVVERLGAVELPVDVRVYFDNDSTTTLSWNGKSQAFEYVYEGPLTITAAEVDPERKINVDINFINNSLVLTPQKQGIRRSFRTWFKWIQHSMINLSAIF